jgi:arsenate reductase
MSWVMKVLFLCTANSCRSILSEALFNHLAPADFRAFSAGIHPSGVVNPQALQALRRAGIAVQGLHSKAVDEYRQLAPEVVITVCNQAVGDVCPIFFGAGIRAHWGLADPSELTGDAATVVAAFDRTLAIIRQRTSAFLALPFADLGPAQLAEELTRIGQLASASSQSLRGSFDD